MELAREMVNAFVTLGMQATIAMNAASSITNLFGMIRNYSAPFVMQLVGMAVAMELVQRVVESVRTAGAWIRRTVVSM